MKILSLQKMKLFCAFLVGLLFCPLVAQAQSPWLFNQWDKQEHLLVGMQATVIAEESYRLFHLSRPAAYLLAMASVMLVATAKELLIDPGYEPRDQWASFAGTLMGGALIYTFRF